MTYMRVIFASIVFSNSIVCNPCDIFTSDVAYNFQVVQYASIEFEIYNNRYRR